MKPFGSNVKLAYVYVLNDNYRQLLCIDYSLSSVLCKQNGSFKDSDLEAGERTYIFIIDERIYLI